MKAYPLVLLGLLVLAGVALAEPVTTVAQVDLGRYTGTWYEIGHFPMYFQRHCVGDTTATYAARADGSISVLNRCRTASGSQEAHGRATVVANSGNARLKVTFFWPFRGDYWIIGLDPDYRWAVVGNPDRDYLWILSRTPELPLPQLAAARAAATAQGFDLSRLAYTPQSTPPAPAAATGP